MDIGGVVDLFHGLSAAVITMIILFSMVVAFIVFKYFDSDFMDRGSWND
jgi:hypothetical protein